jgi:hypothetical protein
MHHESGACILRKAMCIEAAQAASSNNLYSSGLSRISGGSPAVLRFFIEFLSLLKKIPEYCLKLGDGNFRPHSFRFFMLSNRKIRRCTIEIRPLLGEAV